VRAEIPSGLFYFVIPLFLVIPAKAGIHGAANDASQGLLQKWRKPGTIAKVKEWVPAFAGMTSLRDLGASMVPPGSDPS